MISTKIHSFNGLIVDDRLKNQDTINMIKILDRLIKPDEIYKDLLEIDFSALANQAFRLVMLDIDNTLARHGSHEADEFARTAVARIQQAGLVCSIVSNAAPHRVQQYAASLGLPYEALANKPSTKALKRSFGKAGVAASQTVMIGDQLLTDMMAAHRAGCRAILVRPRFPEEVWNVRLKRRIEKILLRRYKMNSK